MDGTPKKPTTGRDISTVVVAALLPHVGAIGKGAPAVDVGSGPKRSSVMDFTRNLRPGDIVFTGKAGFDVDKTFIGLGTGKPYGTHSMVVEKVSPTGVVTFLENSKAEGLRRRITSPTQLKDAYAKLTAVRPVNSGEILGNMQRYVDASERFSAALRARGVPESQVLAIRKASYRGKFNVAVALRQLFVPSFRGVNIQAQRQRFNANVLSFERNLASHADVVAEHVKRTGKIPPFNPMKRLGSICSSAVAFAGADVTNKQSLKFTTPADLLRYTSGRGAGGFVAKKPGITPKFSRAIGKLLRAGPHLVRGAVGIGLGVAVARGLKKVKVPPHTRRAGDGKLIRVEGYEKSAVDKRDAASGTALGLGAGVGVGVKDYFRSKGIHEGIDDQIREGSRGVIKSIKKKKGIRGWLLRKLLKKSKVGPEISIGPFPAKKFRAASLRTGAAVGVPLALAGIAASAIARGGRKKEASIEYHGKTFPGYNQPIASDRANKKKMVLAKKGDKVKLIHFGQRGYKHNYSDSAKKNYLSRSAGIRGKGGKLTKDDKFSANYWARRVLWPKGEADGSAKTAAKKQHPQGDVTGPTRKEYFAALKRRHNEVQKATSPPYEKLKAAYHDPDPHGDDVPPSDAEVHNNDNSDSTHQSQDTTLDTNKKDSNLDASGTPIVGSKGKPLMKGRRFPRLKKHYPLLRKQAENPLYHLIASKMGRIAKPLHKAVKGPGGTAMNTGMMVDAERKKREQERVKKLHMARNQGNVLRPSQAHPVVAAGNLLRKTSSARQYGSHYARSGYGTTEDAGTIPWPKGHDPRKAKPKKRVDRPYRPLGRRPDTESRMTEDLSGESVTKEELEES